MVNQIMSRANTNELSGASNMVSNHVDESGFVDERLPRFNERLKAENDELAKAQKRKRKNDKTVSVRSLEDGRDDTFKSFSYGTKAATLRADKSIAEAAKLIYEVIKARCKSL